MLEIPGVDPAFNQSCALRVAAANGNVNVVDYLLPLSDPSAMDNAAYYDALKHGYTEVGQHLLDSGRLVPPKGLLNALIDAAAGGRYENVALLLQFNRIAPVDERVTDYTPLLRAIEISRNDIVELIMNDQVIRVNVFDSGYNPLIYNAINKGNAEALSMLLNSCRIPLDDYEMGKWPRLAAIQPVLAAYQLNRPCGEEG
jgi:ankyrin repeat protein